MNERGRAIRCPGKQVPDEHYPHEKTRNDCDNHDYWRGIALGREQSRRCTDQDNKGDFYAYHRPGSFDIGGWADHRFGSPSASHRRKPVDRFATTDRGKVPRVG